MPVARSRGGSGGPAARRKGPTNNAARKFSPSKPAQHPALAAQGAAVTPVPPQCRSWLLRPRTGLSTATSTTARPSALDARTPILAPAGRRGPLRRRGRSGTPAAGSPQPGGTCPGPRDNASPGAAAKPPPPAGQQSLGSPSTPTDPSFHASHKLFDRSFYVLPYSPLRPASIGPRSPTDPPVGSSATRLTACPPSRPRQTPGPSGLRLLYRPRPYGPPRP